MICEINLINDWMEFIVFEDKKIIDRWSYSGHKEHIMHLMQKVDEHKIVLTDEQKILIQKVQDSFIYPTDEEIAKEELNNKIAEAKVYLSTTDYKMTVDYFATLTKDVQDELILKRNEAREFIRANS